MNFDFLKQYKVVTGMGSMGAIMKMLPCAVRVGLRVTLNKTPCSSTRW